MRTPIFVRPLTDQERGALEAGLRSSDAFIMRRCQILLASSRGERATHIALSLSCDDQTVRNAIKAFNLKGVDALKEGSSRLHTIERAFTQENVQALPKLAASQPSGLGQRELSLDIGVSGRGKFRARADQRAGKRGDGTGHIGAVGVALAQS